MAKLNRIFSKLQVQHPAWLSRSTKSAHAGSDHASPDAVTIPSTANTSTSISPTEHVQNHHGLPVRVSEKPPLNAPLENLPPEIRREILSRLELGSLQAMVHASPIFHRQYLLDRRFLLSRCLERTLRSATVTVDVCAVYRSGLTSFVDTCTREKVAEFLKSYEDKRSSTDYSIFTEGFSEQEVVAMATFHTTIIQPLVRRYLDWASGNICSEKMQSPYRNTLSMTEETRLIRAMYRFQLCCNIFGWGGHGSLKTWSRSRLGYRASEVLGSYFCIFEPWEIEETFCIYAFVKETYDKIFRDIHGDVGTKNPNLDDQTRPPTPDGEFDFDNRWQRDSLLAGTSSRGLELVRTVLFEIKDHKHLVTVMRDHIVPPKGEFIDGPMLRGVQWERREQQWSERDRKEKDRDALLFIGDTEYSPPLAWTTMWKETYSNLYGSYIEDGLRRWGYIMWDAVRLESTGVRKLILERWDDDFDPRDDFP